MSSLTPLARQIVAWGVMTVCGAAMVGCLALLVAMVRSVWQQSGAIPGWLLAAALVLGLLVTAPSLRWLRVVRLLAGILVTICGTLLTLQLGYAIEHPTPEDPFLGGLMLATVVGAVGALGADLRLQHLEEREAAVLAEQSAARHRELVQALQHEEPARAEPRGPSMRRGAPLVLAGVLLVWGISRRHK